jgi:hypothetical protein
MTTRALKPLAIHRRYNAEKSAAVTAGCDPGQVDFSPMAHPSPLTTLAHVGEPREIRGRGEVLLIS